jgi:hypothetical protein
MSQEVQQKLGAIAQKFRQLVNNSGANLSLRMVAISILIQAKLKQLHQADTSL